MDNKHIVAVIGGACAGSEAAAQLSSKGIGVVVFEQNPLPYGKIEDGLPRWHSKLQVREQDKIDEKLTHEQVHFVPQCKLGQDITMDDLKNMGFSAIILANGAWKDRPMQAEGLEDVKDLSFCYQNPFIYWFNHYHEKNYQGTVYPVTEGAAVIGGGLASIDVAKVCQLQMVQAKLKEMGIEVDVLSLEHKGIAKFLKENDLTYEQLEIKPATLYYRRRIIDMPVASPPDNCTPEKLAKTQQVRQKIIDNACSKYLFQVQELRVVKKLHVKDGSVCGVTFQVNQHDEEKNKLVSTGQEEYVETNFVVSSIGSIPEPTPGISMDGETYNIYDTTTGRLKDYEGVYGVGNAVTGKGNIQVSYKHSKFMSGFVAGSLTEDNFDYATQTADQEEAVRNNMQEIFQYLEKQSGLDSDAYNGTIGKIKELQQQRNYQDYKSWRDAILESR